MTSTRVEPMSNRDLGASSTLLTAADLPTDGLADHVQTAFVARAGTAVVGCVALEMYGDVALLRSLAVAGAHRGQGIGLGLTDEALAFARRRRVQAVYLLTTTAPEFFRAKFGFSPIARAEVPAAVRQSIEFVSACPQSAQAMVRAVEP